MAKPADGPRIDPPVAAALDPSRVPPAGPGRSGERAGTAEADSREPLGRLIHDTRLAFDAELAAAEGRQRFCLPPWEERSPQQRELDMRIGEAVAAAERERAERAEARLAAIRERAREWAGLAPPDDWGESTTDTVLSDAGRSILAIIGSEEEP